MPLCPRVSISTEEGLILTCGWAVSSYASVEPKTTPCAAKTVVRRHHAALRRLPDGMYEIEDLGSSYGTLLNGRAIKKEPLRHQDIVRCGGLLMQLFVDNTPDEVDADASIVTTTLDNLFGRGPRFGD